MQVPRNRWTDGSWDNKLSQFLPLARMAGLDSPNPSLDELQGMFSAVANTKVFAESVEKFVEKSGKSLKDVQRQLVYINNKLGLMEPVPLRSKMHPIVDPSTFDGVALLVPGTISWTGLRKTRTELVQQAGAQFERVVVFHSSRVCDSPADWRHPYIRDAFTKGREPTEKEVLTSRLIDRPIRPLFPQCGCLTLSLHQYYTITAFHRQCGRLKLSLHYHNTTTTFHKQRDRLTLSLHHHYTITTFHRQRGRLTLSLHYHCTITTLSQHSIHNTAALHYRYIP